MESPLTVIFFQLFLKGIRMELEDCSFPLLRSVTSHINLGSAFKDSDYAFLVGARPRGPGMERGDLLKLNAPIFIDCGKAINDNANRGVKALVVGNPCNTNCLILANHAKDLPKKNFHAMTKLDHNRAKIQVNFRIKGIKI